jgi:hypothetical protein
MSGINIFAVAMLVALMIRSVGDHWLQQMMKMKSLTMCIVIQNDCQKSILETAAKVEISVGSISNIFHKDLINIRFQNCYLLVKYLAKHNMMVLDHPPYSAYLLPPDCTYVCTYVHSYMHA